MEEVIDNDDGEELHLKKLAQKDEASDEQEADENDETESGSSKSLINNYSIPNFEQYYC